MALARDRIRNRQASRREIARSSQGEGFRTVVLSCCQRRRRRKGLRIAVPTTERNARNRLPRTNGSPVLPRGADTVTADTIRRLYLLVRHVQPIRWPVRLPTCLPPEFCTPASLPLLYRDTVRGHLERLPGERRIRTSPRGIARWSPWTPFEFCRAADRGTNCSPIPQIFLIVTSFILKIPSHIDTWNSFFTVKTKLSRKIDACFNFNDMIYFDTILTLSVSIKLYFNVSITIT